MKRNKPDSSKIKMDIGPALLIKIGRVNGKKELIEGLVSTETKKMFRNGDYIYFDGFGKLNTESWENGYDKKLL